MARSDDGIEVAAPESVSVSYSEIRTLAADDDGQPTSGQNQNPPVHHSHHLRNFLIVFGAGAVLYVVLAAAAKETGRIRVLGGAIFREYPVSCSNGRAIST